MASGNGIDDQTEVEVQSGGKAKLERKRSQNPASKETDPAIPPSPIRNQEGMLFHNHIAEV
jgi:hypothetical protein